MRDNAFSADNQQERLSLYLAGYTDGEGSFHVAIQRNPTVRLQYQLYPQFLVSQNSERIAVLRLFRQVLGCGSIKPNHAKNERDRSSVYVVRRRHDLLTAVIPFFETYPLMSSKHRDFERFAEIVRAMEHGRHRTKAGLQELVSIAYRMNGNGRYRQISRESLLQAIESSETTRQTLAPPGKI